MKRRALLASLGLSSIGIGAAFGSGAFTTIEADRSVELGVSNDSDAQIALKRGTGTGADRLVKGDTDTDGTIKVIKFDRGDLNRQSKTIFKKALRIKNNTDDLTVDLHVSEQAGSSENSDESVDISDGPVDFQEFNDGSDDTTVVGEDNSTELSADDSVSITVIVDLLGDDVDDDDTDAEDNLAKIDRVTFVVNAVEDTSGN